MIMLHGMGQVGNGGAILCWAQKRGRYARSESDPLKG